MDHLPGNEKLTEMEAGLLAPLALAYVGDSVFDLYVRTKLVSQKAGRPNMLHAQSVNVVNARAQAAFAKSIEGDLTEREKDIYTRGRNAKSATTPKNMSVADYRHATALETLFGWLYLSGQNERLGDLLGRIEIGENG